MIFLKFIDRTDQMPIEIDPSQIIAFKKVEKPSMVIGEGTERYTAIRCKGDLIYEVTATYEEVSKAIREHNGT